MVPFSSSRRSGGRPAPRAAWTAASTSSRPAKPRSTMTSVRNRPEEPRRDGGATPPGRVSGGGASAAGGNAWMVAAPTRRALAGGLAHHVHGGAEACPDLERAGPLVDQDLEAVDGLHPARA